MDGGPRLNPHVTPDDADLALARLIQAGGECRSWLSDVAAVCARI